LSEPITYPINQIDLITEGTILIVDKPLTWTSFDVVNKIKWQTKRSFKLKKFKIGHAGTLDPLASGLLVLCTGKLTRIIQDIQAGEKEYTGTFALGQTTPSFDLETAPEGNFRTDHITLDLLKTVASSMQGEQLQRPPIFSAKWVDGKRAYHAAREGIEIEVPRQMITIHRFEITRFENNEVDFLIRCSKGTYIRSIANDFGQKLESGAYLKALRRTESLPFHITEAMPLEEILGKLQLMGPPNDDVTS
jgi:tRNA pseudouridine55 synthase